MNMVKERRQTYVWTLRGEIQTRTQKEARAFINIIRNDLIERWGMKPK